MGDFKIPYDKEMDSRESLTQDNIDHIWELFFGKKWGLDHIGKEYHKYPRTIAAVIDAESERRWHERNPGKTNRDRSGSVL
jgi:hypothetical protein